MLGSRLARIIEGLVSCRGPEPKVRPLLLLPGLLGGVRCWT